MNQLYRKIHYTTVVDCTVKADGTTIGPPILQVELFLPDKPQERDQFEREVERLLKSVYEEIEAAFRNAK